MMLIYCTYCTLATKPLGIEMLRKHFALFKCKKEEKTSNLRNSCFWFFTVVQISPSFLFNSRPRLSNGLSKSQIGQCKKNIAPPY